MAKFPTILSTALLILGLLSFSFDSSAQIDGQGIEFTSGKLKRVLKKAKKKKQLVFIDVTAEWCMPCKIMEESTFEDFFLGKFHNEHFVNYRLDIDSKDGKKFKTKYGVEVLPSLLYFDKSGKMKVYNTGSQTVEELMQTAEQFVRKNS